MPENVDWDKFLDQVVFGATVLQLLFAVILLLIAVLLGRIAQYALHQAASRKKQKGEGLVSAALDAFARTSTFLIFALSFSIAAELLGGLVFFDAIRIAADVILIVAVAKLLYALVDVPGRFLTKRTTAEKNAVDAMLAPLITKTLRFIIFFLALVQIVSTIAQKEPTTILAGLGIAGVAIGLAAQGTLGNIFGALFIFGNKPFEIGERVVIGGHDGLIKEVGLACTRMERLDGHTVVIPNGKLASETIHNIGKRPFIRRIMNVGITYDTPPEKIREAVAILKDLLSPREVGDDIPEEKRYIYSNECVNNANFPPRVYFSELASDNLTIMVIYWFFPPAYWDYMEHAEALNIALFESFADAGIDFAFPSQTLYLAGDAQRPVKVDALRIHSSGEAKAAPSSDAESGDVRPVGDQPDGTKASGGEMQGDA